MQKHLLINGELVAGEGEKQPVYNPATGEVLLEIAEASAAQSTRRCWRLTVLLWRGDKRRRKPAPSAC